MVTASDNARDDSEKFLVERLPESITTSKEITGISTRIHARRYGFYTDQRRQACEILEKIGRSAEAAISSAFQLLYTDKANGENVIGGLLTNCDPNSANECLTLNSFRNAADAIKAEFVARRECIITTQTNVEAIETTRKELISEVFDKFIPKVMDNSHMSASETCRAMEQDLLSINQIILRNQRKYLSQFQQLQTQVVLKAKQYEERLKMFLTDWKTAELHRALDEARASLEICCDLPSGEVDRIKEQIVENQNGLLCSRVAILNECSELIPPNVSLDKCRRWLKRAEDTTRDLYDAATEGVQEIRRLGDLIHLRFFDGVKEKTRFLEGNLDCPADMVIWRFQEPCMHLSAKMQSDLEHDLQQFGLEISRRRQQEIAILQAFFAFIQGGVWHWELHLSSVAKAEELLDAQLQKQRAAINLQIDSKSAKLKSILENLRHSWSPAATNTQLHAAAAIAADIDDLLKDTWKRMQPLFQSYPSLIKILARGYRQRVCAYFQVRQENSTPSTIQTVVRSGPAPTSSNRSMQQLSDKPSAIPVKLPDIVLDEAEKQVLFELGLTSADAVNLSLLLKSIPEFLEDPRPPLLATPLETNSGALLYPSPTQLTDCFRFTTPKPAPSKNPHDLQPNPSRLVFIRETDSQAKMTEDSVMDLPISFGCVDLSTLLESLPALRDTSVWSSDSTESLTKKFVLHAIDYWEDTLIRNSQSLMQSKKEAFELEVKTRLCGLKLRASGFIDAVVKKRSREVSDHEGWYKILDTMVTGNVSDYKIVDIPGINKTLNDRLVVARDNIVVLEKNLINTSRQFQIDLIKRKMKDEVNHHVSGVRKLVSDFRNQAQPKVQEIQQKLREAQDAMSTFTDNGTYAPEEIKYYTQQLGKLNERLVGAQKGVLDECRIIETKRKIVIDTFLNKMAEKVPAHEADVEVVRNFTGVLARTQAAIKKEAATINITYSKMNKTTQGLKADLTVLERHVISAKVDVENVTETLLQLVQEMRVTCHKLGCLTPQWTVSTPSDSATPSPSREYSIPSSPSPSSTAAPTKAHTSPSSIPHQKPISKSLESSSIDSGRMSTGFRSTSVPKKSRAEPVKEIPTDFQLESPDGPVPLVVPIILAPYDGKGVRSAPSPLLETNSKRGKTADSDRDSIATSANNAAQKRKQKRLERYLVFGETPLGDAGTFLELVHVICFNALYESLNTAEEFHRVRGSRAITRPNLTPETFEMTAEKLCKRFLNYLTQSEQFAVVLMEKCRDLSRGIGQITTCLAPGILRAYLQIYREELILKKRLLQDKFTLESTRVSDLREDVDDINLRPTIVRENDVDGMLLEISQRTVADWLHTWRNLTGRFLWQLHSASTKLFTVCDLIVTSEEMMIPITPSTLTIKTQPRLSTPLDEAYRSTPGQIWKPLSSDEIDGFADDDAAAHDIVCQRTTVVHLAVEEARQKIFAEFITVYHETKSVVKSFEVTKRKVSDDVEVKEFVHLQLKRLQVLDKLT